MIVKINDYGESGDKYFIEYYATGLTSVQMDFLNNYLDDETAVSDDTFIIKMYFSSELYPFQSEVAKFRLDDFIAREEIEMNIFLSSVLDDM